MPRKPKSSLYLVGLVAMVLVVSGCASGSSPAGNGVSILSFEPDFNSVESGEQVALSLKVKNTGQSEAKSVKAILLGIDNSEWQVFDTEKNLFNLLGADTAQGSTGEEKTATFELRAPKLAKGITQTYRPQARVFYESTTSASKKLTFVGEDELRRLVQQGKSLSSSPTVQTAGPLSVEIATGDFVKTSDISGTKRFPLTIKIRNTGGGAVSRQTFGGSEADNLVSMELKLPTGLSFEGSSQCSSGQNTVTLFKGQEADITCDVSVFDSGITAEERTISLSLGYNYFVDSSTSLTVKGTEETFVSAPVSR